MDLGLRDKVVVVGGASRGIGLGIVESCLEEGAKVAMIARGKKALVARASEFASRFGSDRVWARAGDFRITEVIEDTFSAIEDEFGPVWGAVSNVGVHPCPPGYDIDDSAWNSGLDQNLGSAFRMARAALRRMESRREGSFVFISSSAGINSTGGPLTYGTAKAAMNHLAKQLSKTVARVGIRVNAVAPGPIGFPGGEWDQRMNGPDALGWTKWLDHQVPMGRFGKPRDIGVATALLLSPLSSFVTGAVWSVDGGHAR